MEDRQLKYIKTGIDFVFTAIRVSFINKVNKDYNMGDFFLIWVDKG